MDSEDFDWAEAEFQDLHLGDARLDRRVIIMARQVARRPAGRVTRVFDVPAEREGAFRLIENRAVSAESIMRASAMATGRRCRDELVLVPIDTTVLTLTDRADCKGFGPVAGKNYYHRGAFVMSALAVCPDGTTLGLLEQNWWTRAHEPVSGRVPGMRDPRPISERENFRWVEVMTASAQRLAAEGGCPWFQMDRGADCYAVLTAIADHGWCATVRSSYDRRCDAGLLSDALTAPSFMGSYAVRIPRAPGRKARTAIVRLTARSVVIKAALEWHHTRFLPFNLVEVVEVAPPAGVEPIHWRLLTTHPIETREQVRTVVAGYTTRWHIETFHHAWKSGVTNVETSQLRDLERLKIWATFLAIVAARAERLKRRARSEPEVSALEEFTKDEIDAVILLRKPRDFKFGATPTLGKVVLWIAEIGGYTGKSSGGPPGTIVIARALPEVTAAARAIAAMRERSG